MNIFLTGSTGFLGGELLVNLAKRKDVDKIYCLIRALSEADATHRIEHIFDLHGDDYDRTKIIPVLGNLFDDKLTESLKSNKNLDSIDVIMHSAANTSFSRIYDDLVVRANIGGLQKILEWAKDLSHLSTFLYVGTATICGKDIKNRLIFEDESPNLNANHLVKYTFTKMHGELLLRQYLPEDKILIARPSIIMGDSRPWIPRSPVILWALATINLMRLVPIHPHYPLDIISVDYASDAIVQLLFARRNHHVYHISSGKDSATTPFKVTKTIEANFPDRPPFHFLNKTMIGQMKNWAKDRLQPGSELYNYQEYLDYWTNSFKDNGKLRILLYAIESYFEFIELGHVFDNTRLLEDVKIAKSVPAESYIVNSLDFLEKIDVFEGAIDP